MMRTAEWAPPRNRAFAQFSRQTLHHGYFQCLARVQRRQKSRKSGGQHRFARAGRPDHQHVVAAGRRDLERALGGLLALHVFHVGNDAALFGDPRRWRIQHLRALHMIDQRDQRRGRDDLHTARPRRLRTAGCGADEPAALFARRDGGGQHARDGNQLRVEREFAQRDVARHLARRQHAHDSEQAERDGKIVMAAFLRQIRGRQVHHHLLERQREAYGGKCGTHALAAFGDGLVREAHDVEVPVGRVAQMDLDIHLACFDALECDRVDMCDRHYRCPPNARKMRA
jgi:hypothetical protein